MGCKVLQWAAAVRLCHLLSQKEQEQREVAEGGQTVLSCPHLKLCAAGLGENIYKFWRL